MSDLTSEQKAVRALWVAAMRSGKYKQGMHCLRTINDAYCCLGVLCDVVDPSGWNAGGEYLGADLYPPGSICDAAGLTGDMTRNLGRMNDVMGFSFARIADAVDSEFELRMRT